MSKITKLKNLETDTHYFFLNGPFSQWFMCRFEENGIAFSSAEQYMMYNKAKLFGDFETAEKILKTDSPREQKALGRGVKGFDLEIWKQYSSEIVERGNYLKFTQDPILGEFLSITRDKILVEAADYDPVWGVKLGAYDEKILDPKNWSGENKLGKALMAVRQKMKDENIVPPRSKQFVGPAAPKKQWFAEYRALQVIDSKTGKKSYTNIEAICREMGMEYGQFISEMAAVRGKFEEYETKQLRCPTFGPSVVTMSYKEFCELNEVPFNMLVPTAIRGFNYNANKNTPK